jgi:hypothetical protein
MNVLLLFLLQSTAVHAYREELPRFGEVEPQMERHEVYPWIGIQPMAVWTSFDEDLRIEDGWGFGADLTITLDWGKSACLGFRLGVIGWNGETDLPANILNHGVDVRQYRVGVFGSFPFRFLEFGIGANVGGYRYRRDGFNDTAGFFEFQVQLGFRPSPHAWFGVVAMQTLSGSDFQRSNNHTNDNYSIGPSAELRF